MRFEWDERKRQGNIQKHGIDFVDAILLLYTPIPMTTQYALSQPDEQPDKNNKTFSLESQTDWQRLAAMSDDDIDLSDIPALNRTQLKQMKPLSQVLANVGSMYRLQPFLL